MARPHTIVLVLAAATATYLTVFSMTVQGQSGATEAPAGFDNLTNGFSTQAQFDADLLTFEERDAIADGLGPVYNAQSCAECHQNPVTGAVSQISELRAGHLDVFGNFVDAPGGSLINDRAVNAAIQERVPGADNIRTFRMSTNVLGDGIVQNGGAASRNKVRTQPLWGVRTQNRHMHDGASVTFSDSIQRHAGEATFVRNNYNSLSATQQNQIITFLKSL